jgi:hypothetical protein
MNPEEYERRRTFTETMKAMSKSEFIEIARILKSHGVSLSENRSGLYFDMGKLSDEVFEELVKFHAFVVQNNKDLEKRPIIESKAKKH